MRFNKHYDLAGRHAFLSASKYHWINYDDEKLVKSFDTAMSAQRGTKLHELAAMCIELRQRMPRTQQTLNLYVNDAIGYRMKPEVLLYYSPNAFGTVDAISFRNNVLRIHDLKNGISRTSFKQLMIYVAFFCLEYQVKPGEIKVELRIYQNDDFEIYEPQPHEIVEIMDKIIRYDRIIDNMREEAFN